MLLPAFTPLLALTATLFGTVSATPIESNRNPTNLAPRASGRFTWYNPGLGACGNWNGDGDLVAALNAADFDPYTPNGNPNNNSLCGRRLRVSYNGKSVDVTVVDRCPTCNAGDLDLSPAAFEALEPLSTGVIYGSWDWI
ncbi:hypothetical protein VTH82DRAFT_3955 [Thermothelomyces myriococcoides]